MSSAVRFEWTAVANEAVFTVSPVLVHGGHIQLGSNEPDHKGICVTLRIQGGQLSYSSMKKNGTAYTNP